MNELNLGKDSGKEVVKASPIEIVSQHVKATPFGLEFQGELSAEEMYAVLNGIGRINSVYQFYLGDLIVQAEYQWGDKYTEFVDLTSYDDNYLRHLARIARRFSPEFRKGVCEVNLTNAPSWSSFYEVASLDDERAIYFLRMVTEGKWSTKKLREEVQRYKNQGKLPVEKSVVEMPSGWEAVKAGKYVPAPEMLVNDGFEVEEPKCMVQFYKSELEDLRDLLDDNDKFLSIISRIETALEGLE